MSKNRIDLSNSEHILKPELLQSDFSGYHSASGCLIQISLSRLLVSSSRTLMNILNTVSTLTISALSPALAAPHPNSLKKMPDVGTCRLINKVRLVVDPQKLSKNPTIKNKTAKKAAPTVNKIVLNPICQALPFFNVLNKVNRKAVGTTIYLLL